jgi:hypothetical protein
VTKTAIHCSRQAKKYSANRQRQDLTTFVARCFHELNPQAELAMNWHIEVIAADEQPFSTTVW